MTDRGISHKGIELDIIDFSQFNQMAPLQCEQPGPLKTIDSQAFVKNILKNLMKNESFLSFSNQIAGINRILNVKYSSANDIADVILKDVALTSKLLKLVNSSFYGQFSNKGIKTISEAMIILGTEEIKLAAASLKIYELMQNIAKISILKDKTIKALQRSLMARQIAIDEGLKDAETIQISAMLYDFGEYLVAFFFPEIYINIELLADEKNLSKEKASKSIIGISFSNLGRYIASKWHLPPSIIYAMRPVTDFGAVKQRLTVEEFQQYICSFTYELCAVEFSTANKNVGKEINRISELYKTSLDIPASKSVELLKSSWDRITRHATILKAGIDQT